MKNIYNYLMIAALAVSFVSCNKEESVKVKGTEVLKLGSVTMNNIKTKSNDALVCEFEPVVTEDFSLSASATVTPILDDVYTKATETNLEGLKASGFNLFGFLTSNEGTDIYSGYNFIPGAHVSFGTDGIWAIDDDYYWHHKTTHDFWAVSSANKVSIAADGSFEYATDGDDDLLVANKSVYWEDGNEVALSGLEFSHALAKVSLDFSGIHFYAGETEDPEFRGDARCEVDRIEVQLVSSASCVAATNGATWSIPSSPTYTTLTFDGDNCFFVIPQNSTVKSVTVFINDYQRDLYGAYQSISPEIFGKIDWKAGYKYNYKIAGRINVKEYKNSEDVVSLFDYLFKAHKMEIKPAEIELSADDAKTIELSWTGLPVTSSANGGYLYVFVQPSNQAKIVESDLYKGSSPNVKSELEPLIGFIYNTQTGEVVNSTYNDKIRSSVDLKGNPPGENSDAKCEIYLDDVTGPYTLVVAFVGPNGNGQCECHFHNLTIKVLDWK
ncbi:MAG: fimbrillin family protein [Bacteroidales bacterium]|nr:fimbrillin family protein [Bacteroidales bacterium]